MGKTVQETSPHFVHGIRLASVQSIRLDAQKHGELLNPLAKMGLGGVARSSRVCRLSWTVEIKFWLISFRQCRPAELVCSIIGGRPGRFRFDFKQN